MGKDEQIYFAFFQKSTEAIPKSRGLPTTFQPKQQNMGRFQLPYVALTISLLLVAYLNHHSPSNRLRRAINTVKKSRIHVEPEELEALHVPQHERAR